MEPREVLHSPPSCLSLLPPHSLPVTPPLADRSSLPLPEAIHLVELSDRIKHEAHIKSLEREKEIKERHLYSLGERMANAEGGAGAAVAAATVEATRSNARKNYQEYFQTRQQAAVMLDEYLSLQDQLRDQQVDPLCCSYLSSHYDCPSHPCPVLRESVGKDVILAANKKITQ
jgi:hypothetical protein